MAQKLTEGQVAGPSTGQGRSKYASSRSKGSGTNSASGASGGKLTGKYDSITSTTQAYNGQVQPDASVPQPAMWADLDAPPLADLGFTRYPVGLMGQPAEPGAEGQVAEMAQRGNGTYGDYDVFDDIDKGIKGE